MLVMVNLEEYIILEIMLGWFWGVFGPVFGS